MDDVIKQAARELRKSQTPAEKELWEILRNRRLNGKRFLRQHPIGVGYSEPARYFIADFYCPEHRFIIEIDGEIHDYRKEYDELRTLLINQKGISVIRIRNDELRNIDVVIDRIRKAFI